MKLITSIRAQIIADNYHMGQFSALYQFASSKTYVIDNCLRYLQEIERGLRPDFDLHPSDLTKKDERELKSLEKFFIAEAKKHGIGIEWGTHQLYGYRIPYITEETPDEIANKVTELRYLK